MYRCRFWSAISASVSQMTVHLELSHLISFLKAHLEQASSHTCMLDQYMVCILTSPAVSVMPLFPIVSVMNSWSDGLWQNLRRSLTYIRKMIGDSGDPWVRPNLISYSCPRMSCLVVPVSVCRHSASMFVKSVLRAFLQSSIGVLLFTLSYAFVQSSVASLFRLDFTTAFTYNRVNVGESSFWKIYCLPNTLTVFAILAAFAASMIFLQQDRMHSGL